MKRLKFYLTLCIFFGALINQPARANEPIVGMNIVNPYAYSNEDQQTMLAQMNAAGVKVIRASISLDDKGVDFAYRAWQHGIKIEWLIYHFGGYDPFGHTPLSEADPEKFRATFTPILDKLEAKGISLAAFELGNEINLPKTNPEFPIPGKGIQISLDDLYHDAEGQQIGKGFLQYLKVLAVLKDIRDHSKLNRSTPLISAGLGNYERPDGPMPKGTNVDMVGVNTTLAFMRAYGLDNLVDAYGVHIYPRQDGPGNPKFATARQRNLADYDLTACRPAGSKDGKPCWVTEWGFNNADWSCPVKDGNRAALVSEMMKNFRPYSKQGSLNGILYFAWNSAPGSKDINSLWRCGSFPESGKLAINASLLQ